jgi:hypothetical protein
MLISENANTGEQVATNKAKEMRAFRTGDISMVERKMQIEWRQISNEPCENTEASLQCQSTKLELSPFVLTPIDLCLSVKQEKAPVNSNWGFSITTCSERMGYRRLLRRR